MYGIVGAGILITLTTIALYNKRNRWIVTTLILLGSLFNFYIWYSFNILHGHINDDSYEVATDTVYSNALEPFIVSKDSCLEEYTDTLNYAYD